MPATRCPRCAKPAARRRWCSCWAAAWCPAGATDGPNENALPGHRQGVAGSRCLLRGERMRGAALLRHHLGCRRGAGHGTGDRLLGGLVVVVLDLLVVFGQPVDEDADADEQVVGLV